MTRRRWIADEVHGNTAALTGEHAAHLSRVLRAQVGQEFDIAAAGAVRPGRIVSISDQRVEFTLGEPLAVAASPSLTLVLAIFKFDRMEWAIEKCTEIGVTRIVPAIARRTDVHLAAAAARRYERWQRIVREAAEQSRRASPSEILRPFKLKDVDSVDFMPSGPRIVLAESERNTTLRDALPVSTTAAALAVGPEGGWTEDELEWFHKSGWTAASLGNTILRAETAAIVATALALDAMARSG